MKTIALIDDDQSIREVVGTYLHKMGYDCVSYEFPVEFTEDLRQKRYPFDLAITDINMPKVSGLELVAWLNRYYPSMRTLVLTAHASEEIESLAYQSGACLFLQKPLHMAQLHRTIRLLSQEGLSGEVFHITLIDCLQTLACDSKVRILKIQEDGRSHLLVSLQHNQVQGLLYVKGTEQYQGMQALAQLVCIGDATFSELQTADHYTLTAQALNIPLPQIALQIAQYQDESPSQAIKAQVLGISGPTAPKALLSKLLNNIGFEISENPEFCHAHIIMSASPERVERIVTHQKPTFVSQEHISLLKDGLKTETLDYIQAQTIQSVAEWAAYIKKHFIRGVSGTFNHISVFQLIQLIAQASTTGCLQIKDLLKKKESLLYFEQGKLIEACSTQSSGETALLESMRIHMGYFQQIPFQAPPSRQLEDYSVTRLLMNFSRPSDLEEAFIQKVDGLIPDKTSI